MDQAKILTKLALQHPSISKEEKKEFTQWLRSLSGADHDVGGRQSFHDMTVSEDPLLGAFCGFQQQSNPATSSSSRSPSLVLPPQVTISGVSGHIVQINALQSPIMENLVDSRLLRGGDVVGRQEPGASTSTTQSSSSSNLRVARPWRSNSLTPPGSTQIATHLTPQEWHEEQQQQQQKVRSHSLTYVRDVAMEQALYDSNAANMEEEKIEEMIRHLPEGSGMREIREWLKSLRLHKYTKILLEITYEELLQLTDDVLERKGVTLGARGKILKNITLIKERPQKMKELSFALEDVAKTNDTEKLNKILRELESIVLMPLKPYNGSAHQQYQQHHHHHHHHHHFQLQQQQHHQPPSGFTAQYRNNLMSDGSRRSHDSGSDSGTEVGGGLEDYSSVVSSEGDVDVPGQMFDVLKKIYMIIFLSESTNHEVVTVFACLLDRCLKREAFTTAHKQLFTAWLSKMRTVWNPPPIRKATDYKRRSFRNDSGGRRPSFPRSHQPPPVFKNFGSNNICLNPGGNVGNSSSCSSTNASVAAGPLSSMNLVPENQEQYSSFSPRRSMPEIKPNVYSHMKRNSYQEEHCRLPMRGFGTDTTPDPSSILSPSSFFDLGGSSSSSSSGLGSFMSYHHPYTSGSNSSIDARRESNISTDSGYLMSLPESRRDSSLSEADPSNFGGCRLNMLSSMDFRRDSEDLFAQRQTIQQQLQQQSKHAQQTYINRRDSGLSTTEDYLNVVDPSPAVSGNIVRSGGAGSGIGCGLVNNLKNPGSVSSGCASDGSTDSLLEQDLHNLSLSVTQQALE